MNHADLINLWPSLTVFAEDLGVPYVTAKAMRRRLSVPASYWTRMVEAASSRSLQGVTLERLASAIAQSGDVDKFDGLAAADLQPSDGFPGDRPAGPAAEAQEAAE